MMQCLDGTDLSFGASFRHVRVLKHQNCTLESIQVSTTAASEAAAEAAAEVIAADGGD